MKLIYSTNFGEKTLWPWDLFDNIETSNLVENILRTTVSRLLSLRVLAVKIEIVKNTYTNCIINGIALKRLNRKRYSLKCIFLINNKIVDKIPFILFLQPMKHYYWIKFLLHFFHIKINLSTSIIVKYYIFFSQTSIIKLKLFSLGAHKALAGSVYVSKEVSARALHRPFAFWFTSHGLKVSPSYRCYVLDLTIRLWHMQIPCSFLIVTNLDCVRNFFLFQLRLEKCVIIVVPWFD